MAKRANIARNKGDMDMVKRIVIVGVAILLIFAFFGCENKNIPYNARFYGDVNEVRSWISDGFYEAHLTAGAWSSAQGEYINGDEYLQYQTLVIGDAEKLREIFENFPVEVNFEQKMVLMHGFTTSSGSNYEIVTIEKDGEIARVKYRNQKSKGNTAPNASKPLTKWVVVVLDKVDISTAEFALG